MKKAWCGPMGVKEVSSCDSPGSGFVDLGYIHDVVHETTRSTTDVLNWGGGLVATLQDGFATTINFTLTTTIDPNANQLPPYLQPILTPRTSSWVLDTPDGRMVIPVGRVAQMTDHSGYSRIKLKAYPDADSNCVYTLPRTWEDIWHAHVGASLEGDAALAAALLAELTEGYPSAKQQLLERKRQRIYPTSKTPWGTRK